MKMSLPVLDTYSRLVPRIGANCGWPCVTSNSAGTVLT